MKVLTTVHWRNEIRDEKSPEFALIETMDFDEMRGLVTESRMLNNRYCSEVSKGTGLYAAEWWLCFLPLNVKWLPAGAISEERAEELGSYGYIQVSDHYQPDLNLRITSVDTETVLIKPDGIIEVKACYHNTSAYFITCEFPVGAFGLMPIDVCPVCGQHELRAICNVVQDYYIENTDEDQDWIAEERYDDSSDLQEVRCDNCDSRWDADDVGMDADGYIVDLGEPSHNGLEEM